MKVLFHAYNTCCQTESGGVQVRIRKIKSLLEHKGVNVDFFNPYETDLRKYDVLHLFMLRPETASLVQCAKTLGLKIVLSSIVNIGDRPYHIYINEKLGRLYRHLGFTTSDNYNYGIVNNCDRIIVETPREKEYIERYYNVAGNLFEVVPNGVEPLPKADDVIYSLIGKKCNYVLQVGRVDPNKNLLNTIKAVKGANYDLVIVGGKYSIGSSRYYDKCIKEAQGCANIHFLGWLKSGSAELASAYQNAQALIMPSYQETFGLAATEAAIEGCHVCLSKTLPILDYNVFDKRLSFSPSSVNQIRSALDLALSMPKNDDVKNKALNTFSWEQIVNQHINIYSNLCHGEI